MAAATAEAQLPQQPQQDEVTKTKMEQLRRIMNEQKARRRARREAKASPYSTSWSLKSAAAAAAGQLEEQEATATAAAANETTAEEAQPVVPSATNSSGQNSDSNIFNQGQLEPVTA